MHVFGSQILSNSKKLDLNSFVTNSNDLFFISVIVNFGVRVCFGIVIQIVEKPKLFKNFHVRWLYSVEISVYN